MELKKPIASQPGIKNKAKAEPKVPGALGARPEPNPTPQKAMTRLNQDMDLKLMAGLCKMLVSLKFYDLVNTVIVITDSQIWGDLTDFTNVYI